MTRVQLRGCPLEPMCKKAKTIKETNGNTYCYGWFHAEFDPPIPFNECKKCKAFIKNIEEEKECTDDTLLQKEYELLKEVLE